MSFPEYSHEKLKYGFKKVALQIKGLGVPNLVGITKARASLHYLIFMPTSPHNLKERFNFWSIIIEPI